MFQGIKQFPTGLISVFRILLGTFQNNFFQARGQILIPVPYGIHFIWRLTGIVPGKQMIKRSAQTVYVCAGICLPLSAVLFRRRITLRSQTGGIRHTGFLKFPGCSEINEHNLPIRLQHNIRGLHISVDNRLYSGMQVSQHITKLFCPFNNVFLILSSVFLNHTFQMAPFNIVHNNQKGSVPVNDINNTGEVWVMQLFQQVCLYRQPLLNHIKVFHPILTNLFNGPLLICPFIHGQINDTHAALTDFIQYFVFSIY